LIPLTNLGHLSRDVSCQCQETSAKFSSDVNLVVFASIVYDLVVSFVRADLIDLDHPKEQILTRID